MHREPFRCRYGFLRQRELQDAVAELGLGGCFVDLLPRIPQLRCRWWVHPRSTFRPWLPAEKRYPHTILVDRHCAGRKVISPYCARAFWRVLLASVITPTATMSQGSAPKASR